MKQKLAEYWQNLFRPALKFLEAILALQMRLTNPQKKQNIKIRVIFLSKPITKKGTL